MYTSANHSDNYQCHSYVIKFLFDIMII